MSNPQVELREITRDNWRQCARLKVAEDQRDLVAPNIESLMHAIYFPNLLPRAVYDGSGDMVGFLMYGWREERDAWWIYRIMVDERYQGRGYGKVAMEQVLQIMERERPGKEVGISYDSENHSARKLYASLGFVETGVIDEEGEMVAVKPASSSQ